MKHVSSSIKDACQKLKNPEEGTSKALKELFPSWTSSKKKRKFDPLSNSVAAEQQRKKKAAIPHHTGRSRSFPVILLKEIPVTYPRGNIKERLKRIGRYKRLTFNRTMSNEEVKKTIVNGFDNIGIEKFQYLRGTKENKLLKYENQNLDGNAIINLAGSGSLYIQEQPKISQTSKNIQKSPTKPIKKSKVSVSCVNVAHKDVWSKAKHNCRCPLH